MITVLVVEPWRLIREGIRTLIDKEPDLEVIGAVGTKKEAIQQIEKLQPDVVVVDVDLPNLEGIKACSKIREVNSETRVIYLTEKKDVEMIFQGIASGADGFLVKQLYPDMLCQAIRDAARGQYVISGEIANVIVNSVRKLTLNENQLLAKRLEHKGIHFTRRELEIARLMMDGHANRQIADQLHISEGTVKNYISYIYIKLGIKKRDKAMKFLTSLLK